MARIRQGAGLFGFLMLALGPGLAMAADLSALRGVLDDTPFNDEAVPPFHLATVAEVRDRALTCLATAVYYESANQPLQGQAAVAQVVLNRLRHPSFPKSVCGVVYEGAAHRGCQFTFACDGSLARAPIREGWSAALAVANRALDGYVERSVGTSTHYHTTAVHPLWDALMIPTLQIGAHRFYRYVGTLGKVGTLDGVYAGAEPNLTAGRPILTRFQELPVHKQPVLARPAPFSVWGLQVALVKPGGAVVIPISDNEMKDRPASFAAAAPGS